MSRKRMLASGFFAVLALSAVAASSAQAGWLVLGSLLVGTAGVAFPGVEDKVTTLTYSNIEIECPANDVNAGELEEPDYYLAKDGLEFTGCKVVKPTTCTLGSSTIATLGLEALLELDGPLAAKAQLKEAKGGGGGELLATFKLNGTSCASSGKQALTGDILYLLPEGRDERLAQAIESLTATEGELKVGSASAAISGNTLYHLKNDMLWSFD